MSTEVTVAALPACQPCQTAGVSRDAEYDAKMTAGPWAYLCPPHFVELTDGKLGTGRGQRLVPAQRGEVQ